MNATTSRTAVNQKWMYNTDKWDEELEIRKTEQETKIKTQKLTEKKRRRKLKRK